MTLQYGKEFFPYYEMALLDGKMSSPYWEMILSYVQTFLLNGQSFPLDGKKISPSRTVSKFHPILPPIPRAARRRGGGFIFRQGGKALKLPESLAGEILGAPARN